MDLMKLERALYLAMQAREIVKRAEKSLRDAQDEEVRAVQDLQELRACTPELQFVPSSSLLRDVAHSNPIASQSILSTLAISASILERIRQTSDITLQKLQQHGVIKKVTL